MMFPQKNSISCTSRWIWGVFFATLLLACDTEIKHQLIRDEQTHLSMVSETLQPHIDSLSEHNFVKNAPYGMLDNTATTSRSFTQLIEHATDKELIRLTDHSTPSVRVYAFWALAKRQHPIVKDLLVQHLGDTAIFDYKSGCIIEEQQVNEFYLNLLTPQLIDLDCFKLTQEEIDVFRST